MKKITYLSAVALTGILSFSSCKKDTKEPTPEPTPTPVAPSYTIPSTYNFSNATFTISGQRLSMLSEMTTYIKTAHTTTATPILSDQKLKDMFANSNAQFTDPSLNTSGIQLKDKTSNAFNFQTDLDTKFTDLSNLTQTTPVGSNGVAGKVTSGVKAYIFDANGFEYKEALEKGVMGATFYNQATTILKNIATYDNSTAGTATISAMENAWDEAFGYFGVPIDFPTNTTNLKNWGTYCNNVNVAIGSNATIMNAWLKGRAAISNKDNTSRDAARDVVVSTWEKIAAARFITYVKAAKTNIADDAIRNHNLSESVGFVLAFRYNPSKTISDADITTLLSYFGTNLYTVTTTNLDNAITKMATIFNLDPNTL
ncbi:MAG: DUF4856 domain-containing protein [Bacteroidota bacterium]|nr:DUF4856 domain-containing protein [Bacteroidota bacterium]